MTPEEQGRFDAGTAMVHRAALALTQRPGWNFAVERHLQTGVEEALTGAGFTVVPEHALDQWNRIDFMVTDPAAPEAGSVGIECKVKGSAADLRRQITRYAAFPAIERLLVVTTSQAHITDLPHAILGKPVSTFVVGGW